MKTDWLRQKLISMLLGVSANSVGVSANSVVEIERGSALIVERDGLPLPEAEKARLAMLAVRAG